jgi:DNA-binding transcriptional LysR family regulator
LLTPVLAEFQRESGCRIDIQARVELDFGRIIRDLQTDKLDAAVLWSTEQRSRENYPGIFLHEFRKRFDVVLIGGDPAEIWRYSSAIAQASTAERLKEVLGGLVVKRMVTLRADSQPAASLLPQPDRANGGERFEVDTVDAAISYVQAGVADFGLVVANYDLLEPMRRAGQLFFAENPIDRGAGLMALGSNKSGPITRQLIQSIERSLDGLPNSPSHDLTSRPRNVFPEGADFFERLAFGYYIDVPRGEEWGSDSRAPGWRWEEVRLGAVAPGPRRDKTRGGEDARLTFEGTIRNLYGDEFECRAELVSNNLFYVSSQSRPGRQNRSSVTAFVSVFTWCEQSGPDSYIYGHWSGIDPHDDSPTIYSTIWSWRWLSLEELKEITRYVRIRTMLYAEGAPDFPRQPAPRTIVPDAH